MPHRPHIRISVAPSSRRFPTVESFSFDPKKAVISVQDEIGRAVKIGPHRYMWHIWDAKLRPALRSEEERFKEDLIKWCEVNEKESVREDARDFRGDITAMVNVLRCGLSFSDMEELAPSVNLHQLLESYCYVEDLLSSALECWNKICTEGTIDSLQEYGMCAATILPVPVRKLYTLVDSDLFDFELSEQIAEVSQERFRASQIESLLAHLPAPDAASTEIARILYSPYDVCLWNSPNFLPERVGELSPTRLKELLALNTSEQ